MLAGRGYQRTVRGVRTSDDDNTLESLLLPGTEAGSVNILTLQMKTPRPREVE